MAKIGEIQKRLNIKQCELMLEPSQTRDKFEKTPRNLKFSMRRPNNCLEVEKAEPSRCREGSPER